VAKEHPNNVAAKNGHVDKMLNNVAFMGTRC